MLFVTNNLIINKFGTLINITETLKHSLNMLNKLKDTSTLFSNLNIQYLLGLPFFKTKEKKKHFSSFTY